MGEALHLAVRPVSPEKIYPMGSSHAPAGHLLPDLPIGRVSGPPHAHGTGAHRMKPVSITAAVVVEAPTNTESWTSRAETAPIRISEAMPSALLCSLRVSLCPCPTDRVLLSG